MNEGLKKFIYKQDVSRKTISEGLHQVLLDQIQIAGNTPVPF